MISKARSVLAYQVVSSWTAFAIKSIKLIRRSKLYLASLFRLEKSNIRYVRRLLYLGRQLLVQYTRITFQVALLDPLVDENGRDEGWWQGCKDFHRVNHVQSAALANLQVRVLCIQLTEDHLRRNIHYRNELIDVKLAISTDIEFSNQFRSSSCVKPILFFSSTM